MIHVVVIKKVGAISLAKILGILYAFIGLILGAFLSLFGFVGAVLAPKGAGIFGILFGVGAIVFLPIIYGLMGFVSGLVLAGLFNMVTSMVGGLEVETEK